MSVQELINRTRAAQWQAVLNLCQLPSPLSQTAMRPDWGLEPPLRARVITTCREVWFDFVAISALSMSSDSAYGSTDRPCAVLSATQGAEWPHCVLLLIVIGKELPAQTLQYCKGSHVSGLSSLEIAHTADPAPAANGLRA